MSINSKYKLSMLIDSLTLGAFLIPEFIVVNTYGETNETVYVICMVYFFLTFVLWALFFDFAFGNASIGMKIMGLCTLDGRGEEFPTIKTMLKRKFDVNISDREYLFDDIVEKKRLYSDVIITEQVGVSYWCCSRNAGKAILRRKARTGEISASQPLPENCGEE